MKNSETKNETKVAKKPDFKKMWASVKGFLVPYTNLERPVLSQKLEGFLKKNINTVYLVGLILFGIVFVLNFGTLPYLSIFLGGLVRIFIIFVLFRLLCEQLSKK